MTKLVTRDFIQKDISFVDGEHVWKYRDFEETIGFWKIILYEGYNLRPSSVLMVFNSNIQFDYFCLVFAALELGIKIILSPDKPTNTNGYSKSMEVLVKQYGVADLCLLDSELTVDPFIAPFGRRYAKVIASDQIKDEMNKMNYSAWDSTVADFEALVQEQTETYRSLIRKYDIKLVD